MKPKRIQRKRTKGFKLKSPNGLPIVYVGRPSFWGNCWGVEREVFFGKHRRKLMVELYKNRIKVHKLTSLIKKELKGKNLACWCPLDKPCHADILLKIANKE